MLSLGCERLPTPLKKKKKKKKKSSGSLPASRSGYATTITVFFCSFTHILQYLDHHQNLISSCLYYSGPVHKISSQSVHNFLRNDVHRQTNKQTDRQTNQRYQKHNLLCQGGNKQFLFLILGATSLMPKGLQLAYTIRCIFFLLRSIRISISSHLCQDISFHVCSLCCMHILEYVSVLQLLRQVSMVNSKQNTWLMGMNGQNKNVAWPSANLPTNTNYEEEQHVMKKIKQRACSHLQNSDVIFSCICFF